MKLQTKQWFLYGTLFAALGFSVSGNDTKLVGSAHFSSQVLAGKPTADAEAELIAAAEAARLAEAERTRAPIQTASATLAAPTVAPASRGNGNQSSNGGRVATAQQPAFEDYITHVDGHDYKVSIITANGETRAVYSEKTEGSDCKGECVRTAREKVFSGEMSNNIAAIKTAIREELIPKDIRKKKKEDKASTDDESDDDDDSKGLALLKGKIYKSCRHLNESDMATSCKARKMVELLKADKKKAKNRKSRVIEDEDAVAYFNEELREEIKDMLTHKFEYRELRGLTLFEQSFETEENRIELFNEKREAREARNLAKDLIKELLKDIHSDYTETRRAVSSLYKDALKEQTKEALSNLTERDEYARSYDLPRANAALASFVENFGLVKTLDGELYTTLKDGLISARHSGLLENDPYNSILRALNADQSYIRQEYINNPNIFQMGTSIDSALNSLGVTNSSRGMRGNVTSGSLPPGATTLIRVIEGNNSRGSLRGN